ncbi:hypothetical protein [Actinokineospora terrae]|uniref:Uncharacterized protein n=1 Tax=Actinokineospora terrae TaxID=155974 RepID=A0A1H9WZJ4_9PSEU|nr:hypothetical protein [Actinokineospora terrae]SES39259.1 hypothetical protein SAMN04487818_11248 [Actinokineospora terrae]
MAGTGVTPEELLSDFGSLFDAQTRSLRGLATASGVGAETIRGWKDEGRFPKNTTGFLEVVRLCLRSLKEGAPTQRWGAAEWEIRYHEAKRVWEDRTGERAARKAIPLGRAEQQASPSIQVHGGDYVNESKHTMHIGNVNHYTDPGSR